jgi:hypothetical protein
MPAGVYYIQQQQNDEISLLSRERENTAVLLAACISENDASPLAQQHTWLGFGLFRLVATLGRSA